MALYYRNYSLNVNVTEMFGLDNHPKKSLMVKTLSKSMDQFWFVSNQIMESPPLTKNFIVFCQNDVYHDPLWFL